MVLIDKVNDEYGRIFSERFRPLAGIMVLITQARLI